MIQEAVIVMTILGCGDQAQSCDFVLSPEKTCKTQAECSSAIPSVLQTAQGASYLVLTASCDVKTNPTACSSSGCKGWLFECGIGSSFTK